VGRAVRAPSRAGGPLAVRLGVPALFAVVARFPRDRPRGARSSPKVQAASAETAATNTAPYIGWFIHDLVAKRSDDGAGAAGGANHWERTARELPRGHPTSTRFTRPKICTPSNQPAELLVSPRDWCSRIPRIASHMGARHDRSRCRRGGIHTSYGVELRLATSAC